MKNKSNTDNNYDCKDVEPFTCDPYEGTENWTEADRIEEMNKWFKWFKRK